MRYFLDLYAHRFDRNTILGLRLLLLWFAGLSLGFFAARSYGDTLVSFLGCAAAVKPEYLHLLFVTVLPLLLSACAVFLFHPWGIYLVCWFRSLVLGLLLGILRMCYGSASALMAAMLLFSGLLYCPVLIWYWWRRLCLRLNGMVRDTLIGFGAALLVAAVDTCFVSPFLVDVITF